MGEKGKNHGGTIPTLVRLGTLKSHENPGQDRQDPLLIIKPVRAHKTGYIHNGNQGVKNILAQGSSYRAMKIGEGNKPALDARFRDLRKTD
jgi:hypothetical protein